MFLRHFGLREQAFGVTPNPRYLYAAPGYREALEAFAHSIEWGLGFSALVAAPGMGKTTLLLSTLQRYSRASRTALLFDTQCNRRDLLRQVLFELGEDHDEVADEVHLRHMFRHLLLREAGKGRRVLLAIDEAHNLNAAALETIRLLSNLERPDAKLVHILLAGQEGLGEKLRQPNMAQFIQRIPVVARLKPLDREQTGRYIEHRLELAGRQGKPLFTPRAVERIAAATGGVPRRINMMCLNALYAGYQNRKQEIDERVVSQVERDNSLNFCLTEDLPDLAEAARPGLRTVVQGETT